MREPIKLKDCREELEHIRQERAKLDLREVGALKEIKELFNAEVKDFLNGGFKVIKIEKDAHRTIYGIVDKIEYSAWNNGKKVITSGINLYGALLNYNPARDFYTATNMLCLDDSRLFTIMDDIQEITIDELNEKINIWYNKSNDYYLMGDEEEGIAPMQNWFIEEDYKFYFEKYKDVLNNEILNKEFEKNNKSF